MSLNNSHVERQNLERVANNQVNLIAADDPALFRELGCEWNRNSEDIAIGDVLAAQFDACAAPHGIRAWNGPPNKEKAR